MKKLIAMLLTAVMVLGMTACGGNSTPATTAPAGEETTTETTAATEATKVDVSSLNEVERAAAEAEVRYAISLLLDRNYIVNEIGQAGQIPASSFVPSGIQDADGSSFYENAGHNDGFVGYWNVAEDAYEDNYAQAYAILNKYYDFDANGMVTNFPTLTYLYNTSEGHKAIGEYIQSALAGIGINVQLENQEWNTFLNTRKSGDFTMARNGWIADYTDPISFLDMWISGSGNNDAQLGKGENANAAVYSLDLTDLGYDVKVENGTWAETYDVLIGLINTCTDKTTRFALMHKAEDLLMSTNALCPLYFYSDIVVVDKTVEGVGYNPLGFKYFDKTTVNGKGDTISVCIASEPDTIDPALNSALDGGTLINHTFSGLAAWDTDESGKLSVVPDCATELPEGVQNEDGTVTYTYTLRDGMTWTDGKPVTAGDFEFAWKRAASEELGADYGYMFDVVKRNDDGSLAVKALDDTHLEVTLTNTIAYWNELLAFPTFMPVREDVVSDESWATAPATYISNGKYQMTGWEHNSVITLTKNPNYWNADAVSMNEIKFFLSDDENNMLTNWKNDTWQFIDNCPTNEIPAMKAEYPDEFKIVPQIGTYYTCWNVNVDLLPQ